MDRGLLRNRVHDDARDHRSTRDSRELPFVQLYQQRAAFRRAQGKPAPVIDGYTGDQRFFLSWAQVWKRKYREEELRNRVATDPHSPAEYRTNGVVRNLDTWYAAFDVKPEHALYLPPEERVTIW